MKYLVPFVTKRKLKINDEELIPLLLTDKAVNTWDLTGLELRQEVSRLDPGCVILECTGTLSGTHLCAWKGRSSLSLFISNSQRSSLYFKLKGEDRPKQE